MTAIDYSKLSEPFAANEIEWRAGSTTKDGKRCTLLAYLTARAVMDRLDEVVGPARWCDSYEQGPGGGLLCTISIQVDPEQDRWVAKQDGADNTQIEAVKGGLSGAFKRAAVKWGIGRYLYRLDSDWHQVREGWANGKGVDISKDRRHIGWVPYPRLPAWALPPDSKQQGSQGSQGSQAPQEAPRAPADTSGSQDASQSRTEPQAAGKGHHSSWEKDRANFMGTLSELLELQLGAKVPNGYALLKGLCAREGWPKPSAMTQAKRAGLIKYLSEQMTAQNNAVVDHFMPF